MTPVVTPSEAETASFYRPFLVAFAIGLLIALGGGMLMPVETPNLDKGNPATRKADAQKPAPCLNLMAWRMRCSDHP